MYVRRYRYQYRGKYGNKYGYKYRCTRVYRKMSVQTAATHMHECRNRCKAVNRAIIWGLKICVDVCACVLWHVYVCAGAFVRVCVSVCVCE